MLRENIQKSCFGQNRVFPADNTDKHGGKHSQSAERHRNLAGYGDVHINRDKLLENRRFENGVVLVT